MVDYNKLIKEYQDRKQINRVKKNTQTKEEPQKIKDTVRDFEVVCNDIVKKIQAGK